MAAQLVGLAVLAIAGADPPPPDAGGLHPLIVVVAGCAALFMDNLLRSLILDSPGWGRERPRGGSMSRILTLLAAIAALATLVLALGVSAGTAAVHHVRCPKGSTPLAVTPTSGLGSFDANRNGWICVGPGPTYTDDLAKK